MLTACVKAGDPPLPYIRAVVFSGPTGVCGDGDGAGDGLFEWLAAGVWESEDVEPLREGFDVGFSGWATEALRCCPKLGMAVVVPLGSGAGVAAAFAAARAARFETMVRG